MYLDVLWINENHLKFFVNIHLILLQNDNLKNVWLVLHIPDKINFFILQFTEM